MNSPRYIVHPSKDVSLKPRLSLSSKDTIPLNAESVASEASPPITRAETTAQPPRGTPRIVGRDRLLAQLREARRKRCIVLQGPIGSGKTTLLLAWRESLLPLGYSMAWQTFTPDDNELSRGLDHLIACLSQVDPDISREAALLFERGMDDEAAEGVVVSLVRGIAAHSADIVLVLDDVQHLVRPEGHEVFQWLLEYAPQNLHIVLVSRSTIPLSLGRIRDLGLVLELDMRDLRFTAAESLEFLRSQLGDVHPREARRLHELTDGWVAGLQLFAMRLKRRKQEKLSSDAAPTYLLDAGAFAEYFDHEVLSHLADAEVELLVRMSACARLCAPLCLALVGDQPPTSEAIDLLAKLEADNLFVKPAPEAGGQSWYRLNPLFRETLLDRFRMRDETYQRSVHRAAWLWFSEHGHTDDAVRHALLAGESAAAIELVQQAARGMRLQGQFRKLAGLMRLLPQSEILARIDLRLWMVMLHLYARDLDACAAAIATLENDLPADDDHTRYQLTLLRAALAVQHDDPDTVADLMPALHSPPAHADGLLIGAHNNLMSWLFMHKGDYDAARQVHAESPKLLVDGNELFGTSAGLLNARCFTSLSFALEGRIVQAERVCRDALFEANQRGAATSESACLASALLGELLYESNELAAARKLLEERVDVLERISIPDSILRLFTVLSSIHWIAGHHQEAFAYLRRLEDYASRHQWRRLMAHSVAQQVQRHLQMGAVDEAQRGLARLDELASGASPTSIFYDDIQLATQCAHLHWHLFHADDPATLEALRPLLALSERRGWQRQSAQFQFYAALVEHRNGADRSVDEAVMDILRRGSRLGLVRSLLDTSPDALSLMTEVIQRQPHDPVLSFYLSRLQAAQQPFPKPPDGTIATSSGGRHLPAAEMLSERESKVVCLLAKALPNKKIARTLGISPETVKWHLKNIYGKLGVSSRDEAVARVRDLNLDADLSASDTLY